jgi:hypothetical protein
MRPESIKPSAGWYGLGAALAVGGIILAIVIIVRTAIGFTDRIDDFQRIDVPGSDTVTLDTGGYSIYHEYFGADDGGSGDYLNPEVSVSVTAPDGSDVDLESYDSSVTYYSGEHEGVAIYSFEADEAGEYQVSIDGSLGEIAVGRGLGSGIVGGVIAAIASGAIGVLGGLVVILIVAIGRSRERRRRRIEFTRSQSQWPGPPGQHQPAGPYGGWQGQPGATQPQGGPPTWQQPPPAPPPP